MEKSNYNDHTLKSELEGTPVKKEKLPNEVLNGSLDSASPYYKYLIPAIISLLILAIIFLGFLSLDGQRCLSNPFLYGAERVENEDSGPLLCRCDFHSQKYAPFYFNSTELNIGNYFSP